MKFQVLLLAMLLVASLPLMTMQDYRGMKVSRSLIGTGHTWYISCNSNSMLPIFDCKDTLVSINPNRYNMSIGDIIFFSLGNEYGAMPSQYVIHRIVGSGYDKRGLYYITKGDSNDDSDLDVWGFKTRPYYIIKHIIAKVV